MNGSNGHFEDAYMPQGRVLCPVCTCKLKLNAKFDCAERFQRLTEAAQELGFEGQVRHYQQMLAMGPPQAQAAAAEEEKKAP